MSKSRVSEIVLTAEQLRMAIEHYLNNVVMRQTTTVDCVDVAVEHDDNGEPEWGRYDDETAVARVMIRQGQEAEAET